MWHAMSDMDETAVDGNMFQINSMTSQRLHRTMECSSTCKTWRGNDTDAFCGTEAFHAPLL